MINKYLVSALLLGTALFAGRRAVAARERIRNEIPSKTGAT